MWLTNAEAHLLTIIVYNSSLGRLWYMAAATELRLVPTESPCRLVGRPRARPADTCGSHVLSMGLDNGFR